MKIELKSVRGFCAAVLSGILLTLAFAPFERATLAWVALVPLWIACRYASKKRAALLSWVAGLTFFLASTHWLTNVSVVGFVGLSMYCALYFIPFGVIISWGSKRLGTDCWYRNMGLMALASLTMTGFEYLRGIMFTGFAWNPLAVSQYHNLTVAQLAAWGGVALVSALVVWVNSAISVTVIHYIEHRRGLRCRPHFELMAGLMLMAMVTALGWRTLFEGKDSLAEGDPFTVAMIQPAIPAIMGEWTDEQVELVYERVGNLTDIAQHSGAVDMIIWSETILPDFLRNSHRSRQFTNQFATNGVPVLAGSMDFAWGEDGVNYFNSSILVGTDGQIIGKYDKQHLVIFGEYIPMHDKMPWLDTLSPIQSSFTPGKGAVQLTPSENIPPFSVLICFEDTVAKLARAAVNQGARWLVNQSNDSWFTDTEAVQHMAQCVFRAIENRVPIVRCATSGVTCAIDPFGRIYRILRGPDGTIGESGFLMAQVQPVRDVATFYKKYGDVFGIGCAALGLVLLIGVILDRRD